MTKIFKLKVVYVQSLKYTYKHIRQKYTVKYPPKKQTFKKKPKTLKKT